jgi:hypothetical protein
MGFKVRDGLQGERRTEGERPGGQRGCEGSEGAGGLEAGRLLCGELAMSTATALPAGRPPPS